MPGPIYCETTHKLLARRDENGIWLWCKLCKSEHYIPWAKEENKEQNVREVASEADLCYNLNR